MILSDEKPKHRTIDNYNKTEQHIKLVCRPQLTLHIPQQQQMQFKLHNSQFLLVHFNEKAEHRRQGGNVGNVIHCCCCC